MNLLTLHCGAEKVTAEDLALVETPPPTDTHFPLAHADFLREVKSNLQDSQFEIINEQHALSKMGSRYFGVLDLANTVSDDYAFVVGLRNSHDRSFAAAVAGGSRVFVCDNLSFSGEIKLERKHTKFAHRDLQHLTARLVGQLSHLFGHAAGRIEIYKNTGIDERSADHILMAAMRARAITSMDISAAWNNWAHPAHEEFLPRTAWSLFNAITSIKRSVESGTQIRRGEALHGLFDGVCGVTPIAIASESVL
jgi:hypothetical protein